MRSGAPVRKASWQTAVAANAVRHGLTAKNRGYRSERRRRLSSIRSGYHRGLRRPNCPRKPCAESRHDRMVFREYEIEHAATFPRATAIGNSRAFA
jgi:hypothetical protein